MWIVILQLPSGKTTLREIDAPNFMAAAKLIDAEAYGHNAVVVSVQWLQK